MIVPDVIAVCARCDAEFVAVLPDDRSDVFFKVQRELGCVVCPECLEEAHRDGAWSS